MNEQEFNQLAEATLKTIEVAVDSCEGDTECNRSGNVLEVEFDNGRKIIINRHDVNQEIWVAAQSGGFHFRWQEGYWHSRRENSELFDKLVALFAEQGVTIDFV